MNKPCKPLTLALALCLCMALTASGALAEILGGFEVTGSGSYSYASGVLTITGGDVTVRNADLNTPTGDRIYVSGQVNLTIDGVNIESAAGSPMEIDDDDATSVTLTLAGDNRLISKCNNKAVCTSPAAMRVICGLLTAGITPRWSSAATAR